MTDTGWILFAYNAVALTGVFLSIYVMQKTEHDHINKIDPQMLQWARRMMFIVVALALCYTILYRGWEPSGPVLALVSAGVASLAVNALALATRVPPNRRHRLHRNPAPVRSHNRLR